MLKDIVPGFVRSLIGRAYHRLFQGVSVGPGSRVDFSTRFEGHNRIGSNCRIGGCVLGAGTYIADGTTATHVRFGRFCSCGENVSFGLARHPTRDFASTHPAFFSTQRQAGFTFVQADSFAEHVYADAEGHWLVSVGNDVWIGNRAIVLDGVTIHDGAVVGAGAVVTRDVPAYSIVAGVPAETIGRRFEGATVKALLDSRWWDADFDVLRQNAEYFTNADLLLEQLDRLTGTL